MAGLAKNGRELGPETIDVPMYASHPFEIKEQSVDGALVDNIDEIGCNPLFVDIAFGGEGFEATNANVSARFGAGQPVKES